MIAGDRYNIMNRARRVDFEFVRIRSDKWRFYKQHVEENKLKNFYLLKQAGADLNAQTIHGETPLMTAIMCSYNNMVQLLLSEGASVDYKLNPGVAAPYCDNMLGLALACDNVAAAMLLYDAGASDSTLDLLHTDQAQCVLNNTCLKRLPQLQAERPRKLLVLTRKVIRSVLGSNIRRDIVHTGLPRSMQDYVLMKGQLIAAENFANKES